MSMTCLAQTMKEIWQAVYADASEFVSCVGNLQTLWWLVCTIFAVAVFVAFVISFRKNVNKKSILQIEEFSQAQKYIPEIYIELNRNMEYIRYFTHRKSWRRRIIREYNSLFSTTLGKQVIKAINEPALTKKLSYCTSCEKVMEAIRNRIDLLERTLESSEENRQKYGESFFFLRGSLYHTPKKLKILFDQCEVSKSKAMVVVGSAGNGKTNLLCKTVETIMANNQPCLFINARSINRNCYEYLASQLLPDFLIRYVSLYLRIISFFLSIQRKKFYIVIDAINENDSDVFAESIGELTDKLAKFKNIKILYACRSEYFQARYSRYFNCVINKPYVFHLEQVEYSDRAKETLLSAYKKHFNVSGPIYPDAVSRMMHSLFLMRLFFEVNQNKTSQSLELRDAEIYKAYFDAVAARVVPLDFGGIVNRIAGIMISQKRYDGVDMSELNLSTTDITLFKTALDENLIISKNIHIGKGIAETSLEYVYFVFDELRDFCLARYILVSSIKNGDNTYSEFFNFAGELFINRLSPIEGILKYGYYYFKTNKRTDLCKKILETYSDFDPDVVDPRHWMDTRQRVFHDFGIALIFQDSQNILEFEVEYIRSRIEKESNLYWEVFWYLLRNEYAKVQPDLQLAILLLVKDMPFNTTAKIVAKFFDDRNDRYLYLRSDKRRRVEVLCHRAGLTEKRWGQLSNAFKQILIVLAALEPMEPELERYEKYVLSEEIVEPLRDACAEEVKSAIKDLEEKQRFSEKSKRQSSYVILYDMGDLE